MSQITKRNPILIGHLADIHIRTRQYGSTERGQTFQDAFLRAITEMHALGVDVIAVVGDVFDNSRPTSTDVDALKKANRLAIDLGLPILLLSGNHDAAKPYWPETLFDNAGDPAGIIPLDDRVFEIGGWTIRGWPPYTTAEYRSLRAVSALPTADVLLYHGTVAGIVPMFEDDVRCLNVSELPCGGDLKAILLGDIHVPGYVTREGTLIGYPGTLEVCNLEEPDAKWLRVIKLSEEGTEVVATMPFASTPVYRFMIANEDDLVNAALQLASAVPGIVSVEYPASMPHTISVLDRTIRGRGFLLRGKTTSREASALVQGADLALLKGCAGQRLRLSLDDFIQARLEAKPELLQVVAEMRRSDALGAATTLDNYVRTKLPTL